MKAKLMSLTILIPIILSAQNNEKFNLLHNKLKSEFINNEYKSSLKTLDEINELILKKQNIKKHKGDKKSSVKFETIFKNAKNPTILNVKNKSLKIHYGDKILYTINDNPTSYYKPDSLATYQLPVEFNNKLALKNKYIKLNDKTKKIQFNTNNNKILNIDSSGIFKVKNTGNVIITISCEDEHAQIPLKIINIPVQKGMSRDEVIEKLGMPDKVNKKYIEWVRSSRIDGIFYYANTDDATGISVEHWIYNKYPKLILRFGYSGLRDSVMASWNSLSTKKYSLEHN